MSSILVDSNVVLDIVTENPVWYGWSAGKIVEFGGKRTLLINPIVYAELAAGFKTERELESGIRSLSLTQENLPWQAAFPAGLAFLQYRRSGGSKVSPLPDFYIGAHAAVKGYRLLTRDVRRYKTYFPHLKLIAP